MQPQVKGMGGGRGAKRVPEQCLQAARGKAHGAGGFGHDFRAVDPRLHSGKGGGDPGIKDGVGLQGGGLGYSAGAGLGQKAHRDLPGKGSPVAGSDQVQHEIGGGGGTRDGHPVAVDDKAVGDDIDVRVGGGEILKILPVDGGAVTVQKPRARQNPRGGIDAADQLETRCDAAQVADQRAGRDLGQPVACDDDQGVGPHGMGKGAGGGQRYPAGQRHRGTVGADDAPAVSLMPKLTVGVAHRVKRRGNLQDRGLRQDQKGDGQRLVGGLEDGVLRHQDFVNCQDRFGKAAMVRDHIGEDSMPLTMNKEVFITCAVTGAGGTEGRSPHVPRSPKQIAESAIAAAKAGAAVVHCHVRDPETGKPSRRLDYYREVTERIRDSDTDVVLNLTAGMGGDMLFDGTEKMDRMAAHSDMCGAEERVAHIVECRPEICTLDCGTMNFNEADYVMVNTPGMLRDMARRMTAAGVRIEIEAFDTGHLWLAKELVKEGVIPEPVLVQLCMGVPWGAPDDLNTFMAMVNNVPAGWHFSGFGLGRNEMAYVAAATLAGGNARVGLEDNLWLEKGVLATNAQLVERAATIIENMGARVITPAEVRTKLKLEKRAPLAK